MAVAHKVHVADLVDVYGRKPSRTECHLIDPSPPLADVVLGRQKGPIKILVAAHCADDLVQWNILGAGIVLPPDIELVADVLKGKQIARLVSREKAGDPLKKDPPSGLGKGFIGLDTQASILCHCKDPSSISSVR